MRVDDLGRSLRGAFGEEPAPIADVFPCVQQRDRQVAFVVMSLQKFVRGTIPGWGKQVWTHAGGKLPLNQRQHFASKLACVHYLPCMWLAPGLLRHRMDGRRRELLRR